MPIAYRAKFVLPCKDYDGLTLEIKWADGVSFGPNGAGTTHTFAGYGGVGSPRARVHGIYAQWGPEGRTFQPGQIWRTYRDNVDVALASDQKEYRVLNLLTGNLLRSLLLKTGAKATVTTGNFCYSSLSNTILSELFLNTGTNKTVMSAGDFLSLRKFARRGRGFLPGCGRGRRGLASGDGDFRGNPQPAKRVAGQLDRGRER